MADNLTLSPDEAAFFETGVLSDSLRVQEGAPLPVLDAPPVDAEPAPDTAPSSSPPSPGDQTPGRDPVTGRFVSAEPTVNDTAPAPELARFLADAESRRAAAEAQLAALEAKLADLSKPPAPPPPNKDVDPLGHFEHQLSEIGRQLTELREAERKASEQRAMSEQQREFVRSVHALREEFVAKQPDFDAAYKHVRNVRLSELRDLGVPNPEAALNQEEFAFAAADVRRGQNPAARLYERARRYGYTPAAAAQPTPTDKVAAIKAAAEAARNVERGTPPPDALTLGTLKDASEAQLNKLVSDQAAWDRILGKKTSIF